MERVGNGQEEFGLLYAHLEDLCRRSAKGEAVSSSFLSPREQHYATRFLARMGETVYAFGGYDGAERQKLYLLPDYMRDAEGAQSDVVSLLRDFGFDCEICALRIIGSGYRMLTHRDFLGSLLALGVERSVIGDICVDEQGRSAVIFCEERMVPFLEQELLRVANDKVKLERLAWNEFVLPERQFEKITDTVASARLDCVVAALCSLSREKARETVVGGLVEMNFESEDRPDREVVAPSILSVRGFGRYRVTRLEDRTKKGRIRLEAERYR